jgi:type II secretory pathway pseudopilin PulG
MSAIRNQTRANARGAARERGGEQGYTLLMAIFIAALMIIAASAAVPNLILQSRRQKEKLMIWRGEQYERAIGLFYRKTGRYPHDLRELAKGIDGIHFLRQQYKDPMNAQDGSWRLIYLGPGGQLIGSLRWHTLAEYQAAQLGLTLPGTQGATTATGMTGTAAAGGTAAKPPKGFAGDTPGQPQTQTISEGQMVGGNLIGVASKVNAKSVKVYMGAEKYRDWEFIWNPLQGQQAAVPAAPPQAGQTPQTGSPKLAPGILPPTPEPPQQPQQPQQPQP